MQRRDNLILTDDLWITTRYDGAVTQWLDAAGTLAVTNYY